MPIYEYHCHECGRNFSFLYGVSRDSRDPTCPGCQGRHLSRLISRTARVRSEERMLEALADPTQLGDMDDPRSLAKWAKQMGGALGDEAGEDFGEVMHEMLEAEAHGERGEDGGGPADEL